MEAWTDRRRKAALLLSGAALLAVMTAWTCFLGWAVYAVAVWMTSSVSVPA